MNFQATLGILFALTSAVVWGSGDFSGGYASRRSSAFQVLVLSAISGLLVLVLAALVWRETFPSLPGIIWSMLAGASGALGIAALYRALAIGPAALVAPLAAVISAMAPVMYTGATSGLPGMPKLAGFGLAMAGIWLVSAVSGGEGKSSRQGILLAVLAGIGFGGFFTFLGLVEPGKIFTPIILSRCLTLLTGLVLLRVNRLPFPALTSNRYALLAGLLDAGGNLFYILARQYTRLDIAAVLASLYPASTVVLAAIVLKEKISPRQGLGVLVCLGAIGLITI